MTTSYSKLLDSLLPNVDVAQPDQLRRALRQIVEVLKREAFQVRITYTNVGSHTADLNIQVTDNLNRAQTERMMVLLWVSTTAGGAPGGSQTLTLSTGTVISSFLANQCVLWMTDGAANITATLALSAAGARYINAVVLPYATMGAVVTVT